LHEIGKEIDVALELDVEKEVLLERMIGRAKTENRSDDTPEVIEKRLNTYYNETAKVVNELRKRGILTTVDSSREINEIADEIKAVICDI
jgi:adenylate kinase